MGRQSVIALVLVGLVGCGPAQPTSAPTSVGATATASAGPATTASPRPAATPTFLCTPEAGGSSLPCTEDEYKDAVVRNAQYARAEAVYRNYLIKYVRAMRLPRVRWRSSVSSSRKVFTLRARIRRLSP